MLFFSIIISILLLVGVGIFIAVILPCRATEYKNLQQQCIQQRKQIQQQTDEAKELTNQLMFLRKDIDDYNSKRNQAFADMQWQMDELHTVMEKTAKANKEASNNFANLLEAYTDNLDKAYSNLEQEYENNKKELFLSYDQEQIRLINELEQQKAKNAIVLTAIEAEIEKLRTSREALIDAQRREQEIQQQQEFYSLQIAEIDLNDIRMLEKIKPSLSKPRVLSMLIWTTFFRTPMTTLCNNILGAKQVCGIYKITNKKNGACYIGQARDIGERWKQHAKCGLDIDCPVGNKLYAAMKQDGLWNFTWELLEECPSEQLNEKEKFYIDIYDSKNFGYNSTMGVGK